MYLDNFCTSIPLLGRLRHDLKIGGRGTARASSALLPSELKAPKSDMRMHDNRALEVAVAKDSVS